MYLANNLVISRREGFLLENSSLQEPHQMLLEKLDRVVIHANHLLVVPITLSDDVDGG